MTMMTWRILWIPVSTWTGVARLGVPLGVARLGEVRSCAPRVGLGGVHAASAAMMSALAARPRARINLVTADVRSSGDGAASKGRRHRVSTAYQMRR